MDTFVSEAERRQIPCQVELVHESEHRTVGQALCRMAEALGASCLVLASHRKSRLEQVLTGSVSRVSQLCFGNLRHDCLHCAVDERVLGTTAPTGTLTAIKLNTTVSPLCSSAPSTVLCQFCSCRSFDAQNNEASKSEAVRDKRRAASLEVTISLKHQTQDSPRREPRSS